MFLKNYLNEFNYSLLKDTYNEDFISLIDENNFIKIYNILINNNLKFTEDIILNYLDLFTLDSTILENKLNTLITKLGNNYPEKISKDLSLLNELY